MEDKKWGIIEFLVLCQDTGLIKIPDDVEDEMEFLKRVIPPTDEYILNTPGKFVVFPKKRINELFNISARYKKIRKLLLVDGGGLK